MSSPDSGGFWWNILTGTKFPLLSREAVLCASARYQPPKSWKKLKSGSVALLLTSVLSEQAAPHGEPWFYSPVTVSGVLLRPVSWTVRTAECGHDKQGKHGVKKFTGRLQIRSVSQHSLAAQWKLTAPSSCFLGSISLSPDMLTDLYAAHSPLRPRLAAHVRCRVLMMPCLVQSLLSAVICYLVVFFILTSSASCRMDFFFEVIKWFYCERLRAKEIRLHNWELEKKITVNLLETVYFKKPWLYKSLISLPLATAKIRILQWRFYVPHAISSQGLRG